MTVKKILLKHVKPKFYKLWKYGVKPTKILDVGIANFSYQESKSLYPLCEYHGVDIAHPDLLFKDEDKFILCNLDKDDEIIKIVEKYDLIIANHVLEHLANGEKVFAYLCNALIPGGVLYVEFPSIKTAYRKKNKFNYHFHDDETHKRFYKLEDLANIAIENHCRLISCGPASTPLKNLLSLPRGVLGLMSGQGMGSFLIHLTGKVDHIFITKPIDPSH